MSDQQVKVEISVRVTTRDGYNTSEIAAAKIEDNVAWDDVAPETRTSVTTVMADLCENVLVRATRQLRVEHERRTEVEREAARQAEQIGL